jgi:nucleoid DNA-binding protein
MAKTMSKSELIQKVMEQHPTEIARKDVKGVIEASQKLGTKNLRKRERSSCPASRSLSS